MTLLAKCHFFLSMVDFAVATLLSWSCSKGNFQISKMIQKHGVGDTQALPEKLFLTLGKKSLGRAVIWL